MHTFGVACVLHYSETLWWGVHFIGGVESTDAGGRTVAALSDTDDQDTHLMPCSWSTMPADPTIIE